MAAYAYPGAVPYSDPTAVQGRRIGAFFIDAAILTVVAVVLFFPFHSEESRSKALREGKCHITTNSFNDSVTTTCDGFTFESEGTVYFADPAWFWANLAVSAAYYVLLQGLLGATIGKLMVGLRVVRPDGSIAHVGWAGLRWLFFWVDGPLTFFICGLVTFLVSKGHRRVGDMIASTYVVRTASVGQPVVLPVAAAPLYPPVGYYPPPGVQYPGQGYPPMPGQAYPPPGQAYPPPGQAYPPPAAPPVAQPPVMAPAPSGPQWDNARNTYVQIDPETGIWHAWNTRTSTWEPLH